MTIRTRRVVATAALAIVAVLVATPGLAAAATSRQTQPRPNKGIIEMTERVCDSSYGWQRVAADNGLKPPYTVYLGRSYKITCYKPGTSTKPASKPASRPSSSARVSSTGWTSPLPGRYCYNRATSGWGAPRSGHSHQGIDIDAPTGTPIRAAATGKVVLIKWQAAAGWYVVVDHGAYQSVYMHENFSHLVIRANGRHEGIAVRMGQRVAAGQTIAYVGSLGQGVTGPHLHYEVHHGLWWNRIDPASFMRRHDINLGC